MVRTKDGKRRQGRERIEEMAAWRKGHEACGVVVEEKGDATTGAAVYRCYCPRYFTWSPCFALRRPLDQQQQEQEPQQLNQRHLNQQPPPNKDEETSSISRTKIRAVSYYSTPDNRAARPQRRRKTKKRRMSDSMMDSNTTTTTTTTTTAATTTATTTDGNPTDTDTTSTSSTTTTTVTQDDTFQPMPNGNHHHNQNNIRNTTMPQQQQEPQNCRDNDCQPKQPQYEETGQETPLQPQYPTPSPIETLLLEQEIIPSPPPSPELQMEPKQNQEMQQQRQQQQNIDEQHHQQQKLQQNQEAQNQLEQVDNAKRSPPPPDDTRPWSLKRKRRPTPEGDWNNNNTTTTNPSFFSKSILAQISTGINASGGGSILGQISAGHDHKDTKNNKDPSLWNRGISTTRTERTTIATGPAATTTTTMPKTTPNTTIVNEPRQEQPIKSRKRKKHSAKLQGTEDVLDNREPNCPTTEKGQPLPSTNSRHERQIDTKENSEESRPQQAFDLQPSSPQNSNVDKQKQQRRDQPVPKPLMRQSPELSPSQNDKFPPARKMQEQETAIQKMRARKKLQYRLAQQRVIDLTVQITDVEECLPPLRQRPRRLQETIATTPKTAVAPPHEPQKQKPPLATQKEKETVLEHCDTSNTGGRRLPPPLLPVQEFNVSEESTSDQDGGEDNPQLQFTHHDNDHATVGQQQTPWNKRSELQMDSPGNDDGSAPPFVSDQESIPPGQNINDNNEPIKMTVTTTTMKEWPSSISGSSTTNSFCPLDEVDALGVAGENDCEQKMDSSSPHKHAPADQQHGIKYTGDCDERQDQQPCATAPALSSCNCESCAFNRTNGGPLMEPCHRKKGMTGALDALQKGATYRVVEDIPPKVRITKVPINIILSDGTTFHSLEDAVKAVFWKETGESRKELLRELQFDVYHKLFGLRFREKATIPKLRKLVDKAIIHEWKGADGSVHQLDGKIDTVERDVLSGSLVCQVTYSNGKTMEWPVAQALGALWDKDKQERKEPSSTGHRIIPMKLLVPQPTEKQYNLAGWMPVGLYSQKGHEYTLEIKRMKSTIKGAGFGVFIRARITSGGSHATGTHLELVRGTLIDLGMYGNGRKECILSDPVFTTKGYIFNGKNLSYAFSRGSGFDVIDVTNNEASELLPEAAGNLLPYINEVSGSLNEEEIVKNTNVTFVDDPEGSPHFYFGNRQYTIKVPLEEPTELLADYGESYDGLRNMKGYRRLLSKEVQCQSEDGVDSFIDTITDMSFNELQLCAHYISKRLPSDTMSVDELIRAFTWTDRVYKELFKMLNDSEFSIYEKNNGFDHRRVLNLLLQLDESRRQIKRITELRNISNNQQTKVLA